MSIGQLLLWNTNIGYKEDEIVHLYHSITLLVSLGEVCVCVGGGGREREREREREGGRECGKTFGYSSGNVQNPSL